MADRIRLLSDVVANQIAAGEVVNNPSSVVKEMMENAVDAGTTSVTVNFRDGGMSLIQVVDNGCGMSPLDARMAFDRHATSKIASAEDIYNISTFGFRGEALASIAAVAEVEVRTRQKGDQLGTSVEIGGGVFRAQNAIQCAEGTQFFVRNLFYNIPARKRFLEDTRREARRLKEEFRRVALCNPGIEFKLYENDAPLYNLPPTPLRGRIVGVIGKNIGSNLLEVSADTSIVKIEGFVGRPAASKQNNTEQYFFVNGRYFKSAYFHKAVMDAYEKLIPPGTKPSYFLYLKIDTQRVDVNVHPQKTEVKFEDGGALRQIINAAVRESLAKLGALPMMDFDIDTSVEIPVHRPGMIYKSPEIQPNPDFNPFNDPGIGGRDFGGHGAGPFSAENGGDNFITYPSAMGAADADPSFIEFIEGGDAWQSSLELDPEHTFSAPLPISARWCAAVFAGELLIIDVRRAWEAVLYDRYLKMLGQGAAASQGLLFPEAVSLSMEEVAQVRAARDELHGVGFGFT
ncbi:MAG: DNA mismatch repair endonuclease MutL, partial [Rikenellaceae bacterium]|nr:DNA mismatch repair endonuclease MutL [Rikenellaceae bacterium]